MLALNIILLFSLFFFYNRNLVYFSLKNFYTFKIFTFDKEKGKWKTKFNPENYKAFKKDN